MDRPSNVNTADDSSRRNFLKKCRLSHSSPCSEGGFRSPIYPKIHHPRGREPQHRQPRKNSSPSKSARALSWTRVSKECSTIFRKKLASTCSCPPSLLTA